jgi:hypothetical protein
VSKVVANGPPIIASSVRMPRLRQKHFWRLVISSDSNRPLFNREIRSYDEHSAPRYAKRCERCNSRFPTTYRNLNNSRFTARLKELIQFLIGFHLRLTELEALFDVRRGFYEKISRGIFDRTQASISFLLKSHLLPTLLEGL